LSQDSSEEMQLQIVKLEVSDCNQPDVRTRSD